jgi:hypothetical protein
MLRDQISLPLDFGAPIICLGCDVESRASLPTNAKGNV